MGIKHAGELHAALMAEFGETALLGVNTAGIITFSADVDEPTRALMQALCDDLLFATLELTCDDLTITANGTDATSITVTLRRDGQTVARNRTVRVEVSGEDSAVLDVVLTDGVGSITVQAVAAGAYTFTPLDYKGTSIVITAV